MRTTILCKLSDCESHNSDLYCTASDILIDENNNCQNYKQKCDHIIGTISFYNRYTNDSADTLVFQSDVDDEYNIVTYDSIEKTFDYCPLCGQKNSF